MSDGEKKMTTKKTTKRYRLSDTQIRALETIGDGLETIDDCSRHVVRGEKTLRGMNTTTLRSLVERSYLDRELLGGRNRDMKIRCANARGFRWVSVPVCEYRWTLTDLGRVALSRGY